MAMKESLQIAPEETALDLKDIPEEAKALWYAVDDFTTKFDEAMEDDFNTALAIGHTYELVRELNKIVVPKGAAGEKADAHLAGVLWAVRKRMQAVSEVLGIFQCDPNAYLDDLKARRIGRAPVDTARVDQLVNERTEARKAKNFKRADEIRDELAAMGVELEDKAGGTVWKLR
jgi:cysteinyl-tRNA synthetase